MSHASARIGFTPSTHSLPANTSTSPYAPSQPGGQPSAAPAPASFSNSNVLLTNKLIPRDYLSSKPRLASGPSGSISRSSPLASEAGTLVQHSPASDVAHRQPRDFHATFDPSRPVRQDSTSTSDKESFDVDEDELVIQRTRSPESTTTAASIDSSTLSSRTTLGLSSRTLHNNMPRTSSIDSAISSVSASSQQRREHGDTRDPSPSSIRNLIATAGSAETLVLHLLKEKNHVAGQNGQLWKLVEKQRALLLGLNKDLERVTKDRDKYKKKLKEIQAHGSLPQAATGSPTHEHAQQRDTNAVKPPETAVYETAHLHHASNPASHNSNLPVDAPGPAIITTEDFSQPSNASNERPVLQTQTSGLVQPTFALTEATPMNEKPLKGFSASRKAAPKPLTLLQNNNETTQSSLMNAADRSFLADDDDDEPRGRRKTREDDDKDREKSLMKEKEERSKSAKQKIQSVETSEGQSVLAPPHPPPGPTLPLSPRPQQTLAPGFAQNTSQQTLGAERLVPAALRSPGLPVSPRPQGQSTFSALPMSPRAPPPGPLSPRAPKQPIPPPMMSPSPFQDPAVIQRQNAMARQAAQQSYQQQDRLQIHEPSPANDAVPAVYQGLVSSQYPNLLLPPNALPSIQIRVASSRLRPSRHSMLGLRTQEDSTVFSLSIFSRASRNELWRIEKIPAVLPQLEQQLKPRCRDLPRLPDRKLFSGHSPAVIDARRQAVDAYFEDLLDIEMDEPSALLICRFLSTDVLDPSTEPSKHPGVNSESLPQITSLTGKVVKTGFLTKRGKNFGGWKSRYFILDSPELRYYETPGGPHLGTIKLSHAKIGSQKPEEPASTDPEDQYRHAFLIQEPKKKDSAAYVRHVLCAENDADRDEWVTALLHYVDAEHRGSESPAVPSATVFANRPTTSSGREKPDSTPSNTPSPTSPSYFVEPSIHDQMARSNNISGPINGAPIQDSTQWGNRSAPQPKEKKGMGNLFHFKKSSNEHLHQNAKQQEQSAKPRVLRHTGYVRPVFGLPLLEAVEFCPPFNVDVQLPAVVYRAIEYLRFRKAANEEGLFRLSGSNIVIKTLKERFNTEGDVDLVDDEEHYDVHAVASLFKTYLRELPMPVLTRDLHIEFLKVLEFENQADKVKAFNILVHRLPTVNFCLLRAMSEYLLEVTENSAKNKMSIRNMGIVFSPTVNIPTPVFNLFLSEFDAIFNRRPGESVPQTQVQEAELRVLAHLAPAEIRSPRHQMFSDLPTPAYHQAAFTPIDPAPSSQRGHAQSGSGEFGFAPIHPSYETGQYISHPQDPSQGKVQAYAPPSAQRQYDQQGQGEGIGEEQYGSLNRMLVPQGASSDRRRKRESAMLF